MRIVLFTCILLFFQLILNAQLASLDTTFRVGYSEQPANSLFTSTGDFIYFGYLSGNSSNWPETSILIRKFSSSGELQWRTDPPIMLSEINTIISTVLDINDDIYFIVDSGGCDFGLGFFLLKLSGEDGSVIWSQDIDHYSILRMHHTDGLWFNKENKVYHMNSNGVILDSLYHPTNTSDIDYFNIHSATERLYIRNGNNSSFKDENSNWISTTLPDEHTQINVTDTGLYGITADYLLIINSSLEITKSQTINLAQLNHANQNLDNNHICILDTNSIVQIFDEQLDLIQTFDWPGSKFLTSIRFNTQYISLLLSGGLYTHVKHIPLTNTDISFSEDIEIRYTFLDTIYGTYGPTYVNYILEGLGANVKNNSQDTLRYLELYTTPILRQCSFGCLSYIRYTHSFENLIVPPNDSITLSMPDLYFDCQWGGWEDFCIYATRPNKNYEINTSNNSGCVSFDKLLNIENPLSQQISIYPNPSSEFINISVNNNLRIKIQMFDTAGKSYILTPGNNNISHLSSGTYYIEFTDGNKTTIKPFMKL